MDWHSGTSAVWCHFAFVLHCIIAFSSLLTTIPSLPRILFSRPWQGFTPEDFEVMRIMSSWGVLQEAGDGSTDGGTTST